mmetsp:Transcript_11995/g.19901  ORF Transcript_11995/g.19901 Transcript_11995/m.19901 type:complete len:220 (+) Transcript_11995:170-829(+)
MMASRTATSRIVLTRLMAAQQPLVLRGSQRLPTNRINTALPLFYNLQARSMVMITKTAAGTTPLVSLEDEAAVSAVVGAAAAPEFSSTNNSLEDLAITTSCFKRIESLASKRGSLDELYLRVYVDAGGCSGFQYKFELTLDSDEAIEGDDVVYTDDGGSGARVVVDPASLDFLRGSKIDFVQEMIKSSFAVVDNPQSESACGCGSSFAVKNFSANPALD